MGGGTVTGFVPRVLGNQGGNDMMRVGFQPGYRLSILGHLPSRRRAVHRARDRDVCSEGRDLADRGTRRLTAEDNANKDGPSGL